MSSKADWKGLADLAVIGGYAMGVIWTVFLTGAAFLMSEGIYHLVVCL